MPITFNQKEIETCGRKVLRTALSWPGRKSNDSQSIWPVLCHHMTLAWSLPPDCQTHDLDLSQSQFYIWFDADFNADFLKTRWCQIQLMTLPLTLQTWIRISSWLKQKPFWTQDFGILNSTQSRPQVFDLSQNKSIPKCNFETLIFRELSNARRHRSFLYRRPGAEIMGGGRSNARAVSPLIELELGGKSRAPSRARVND